MRKWDLFRKKKDKARAPQSASEVAAVPPSAALPTSTAGHGEGIGGVVTASPSPVLAVELPPASVLAQLPAAGDVYAHLFSQLAERTREAYEADLSALAAWLQLSSSRAAVGYFLSLTAERAQAVALGWLQHMTEEEHLAAATQGRRLSALRSVVKIARSLGVVAWTLSVKAPKAPSLRDTRGFDVAVAQKLLGACGGGLVGLRDEVLVRLLYTLALRRVEIARLRVEHFDGYRLLVHGKGWERDARKVQWMTLPPHLAERIARWIREARREPEAPLLCGWKNKSPTGGLTAHGIRVVSRAIEQRAGVDAVLNPHEYRRSAVNELIDRDVALSTAQSLLRHEDPKTTSGYYRNREDAALKAAVLLEKVLEGEE